MMLTAPSATQSAPPQGTVYSNKLEKDTIYMPSSVAARVLGPTRPPDARDGDAATTERR